MISFVHSNKKEIHILPYKYDAISQFLLNATIYRERTVKYGQENLFLYL